MEFEHIVMKCKDENTNYPDPPEIFRKDGSCKFAYVTLVMLGDTYIAGAIILAHSIRKAGSLVDLVVLVTPDVTEEGKNILRKFFTHVIEIDFINVPNWRVQKQPHRKYLSLVFTKFHLFNLTQYEKVLLIDADALVLKYPDHLFTLNAPAGCLIEKKEQLITYDKNGMYVYPKDGELKWYKEMCDCCGHGKKIDKNLTDKVFSDFKNSGIGGGIMLLEPKTGELDKILKDVSQGKGKWLVGQKYVWPEQQYLTGFYSGKWTSINPRFFGLQGYPHWSVLYGLQYGGDKPFVEQSKAPITERMKYDDFVLWHQYYYDVLKIHPELHDANSLKGANTMNKFFQSAIKTNNRLIARTEKNLTRQFVDYIPKKQLEKNVLAKLYSIEENRIKNEQLKYYHGEIDCDYNDLQHKPMWNDIEKGDYLEPLKRLAKYFGKKSYYDELLQKCPSSLPLRPDLETNVTLQLEIQDKDLIMLEYLKCRPNIFVLTIWPLVLHKMTPEDVIKTVSQYGEIVYTKNLTLGKNGLYNLMYWMYDDFTYEARFGFIDKKMNYVQAGESNEVLIIYLENTKNLKIAGQGAPTKKEIRDNLMNTSGLFKNKDIRGNDVVHINDFFYQTIAYSQILLNENTLKMLEIQNVRNISNKMFTTSRLKMQTLKKWCSNNLSSLEQERLVLMGGTVLFSHGVRVSNDIDAIFVDVGNCNSQSEEELGELLNDNFNKEETKFFFSDIGIENHPKYWKTSWTEKNNKILNYFDTDSFIDVATNPENHYYFNGFKIYVPKYEIYRKLQRNRKQDHADFLMMATLWPTLLSEFVRLNEGKLIYDIKDENIKEPKLDHHYLKILFQMIYQRYLQSDIEKFKKLIHLI